MALDHSKVVLAGILPDRRDMLLEAMRWLEPSHFSNQTARVMWQVVCRFYDLSGGVLTRRFIQEIAKVDAARAVALGELYDVCATARVSDSEMRASIHVLRRIRAESETGEAITHAMELLTRGGEVDGRSVEPGHESAWSHLNAEYARIAHLGSLEGVPEGDVMSEQEAAITDYAERKKLAGSPAGAGVRTGIASIDRITGGFQPGEFILMVGYTGAGKSAIVAQTAWHAATQQGRNVFYATSETTREMTRRRIYARHSRLERFGVPGGLDSKDMKQGTLSPSSETVLRAVGADLAEGVRTGQYGHLYVAQVPPDATWAYVAAAMRRISARWKVDLLVVDYLALLKADRPRDNQVHEFTDMMKSVKTFATSADDGHGVVVLSPWSVSQRAYHAASEREEYSLANLADTSEAEKSPDMLIWLLPVRDERSKVDVGFLKNRDGEVPPKFRLETDFRSTFIGPPHEAEQVEKLLGDQFGATPA